MIIFTLQDPVRIALKSARSLRCAVSVARVLCRCHQARCSSYESTSRHYPADEGKGGIMAAANYTGVGGEGGGGGGGGKEEAGG